MGIIIINVPSVLQNINQALFLYKKCSVSNLSTLYVAIET